MISITEQFVEAAAPNTDAAKNGRGLVLKNKFLSLHRSADDTLLFGECQGSGKPPYLCSADFAAPEAAVWNPSNRANGPGTICHNSLLTEDLRHGFWKVLLAILTISGHPYTIL